MNTPLKKLRKQRGLTIYDVAKDCSSTPATISRIERGVHGASRDTAERISKYFGGAISEEQILYPERFQEQVTN